MPSSSLDASEQRELACADGLGGAGLGTAMMAKRRLWLGLRHDGRDAWLLAAAGLQAMLSVAVVAAAVGGEVPTRLLAALLLGGGIWWNANTIAHIHMHRPLFRARGWNRLFAGWLSLTTLIPQTIWRHRHLWHHTGRPGPPPELRLSPQLAAELLGIAAILAAVCAMELASLALVIAPGFGFAMVLCQLQGHYEHHERGEALAAGISHYSRWYNFFWFHDGFHIEHHLEPACHWTALPALRQAAISVPTAGNSALPPVLRWASSQLDRLEAARNALLGALERLAMAWPALGAFMVESHRRAFAALLASRGLLDADAPFVVVIVGGGLFPRTLFALAPLLPQARFRIVDGSDQSIAHLASRLAEAPALRARVEVLTADFDALLHARDAALVILPLALRGSAESLAARCPCPVVAHRWLFADGNGPRRTISVWLCKRIDWLVPMANGGQAPDAAATAPRLATRSAQGRP